MTKSAYIHIPFCKSKCKYCSFVSYNRPEMMTGYVYALLKDISENYRGEELKTLYFGGGTPSLLPVELLEKIIKPFIFSEDYEFTLEINPDDRDLDYFKQLKSLGVNRLSIGSQTFDDKILKLMNRKYDLSYFEDKINKLRSIRKDVSITTDIIVGFPLEEENDFIETINNAKKFNFSKIHVFPYSVRTGTKAASMKQIDGNIKKDRARRLLRVSNELAKAYQEKFIGKEVEVLIEKDNSDVSFGHTGNYLAVKVAGSHKQNTFVKAKVIAIDGTNCLAREEQCQR